MAECKHELKYLVGHADGITCQNCGKTFKTFEEIHEQEEPKEAVAKADPPKRTRKKKGET